MFAQLASALVGIWLMAAPAMLNFAGAASTNARIVGPLVASFGVIAMAQCTRNVRRANLPLALWLLLAPLFLPHSLDAALNSLVCGVAIGTLSLVRGRITRPFAGGWASLWRAPANKPTRRSPRRRHQPEPAA